MDQNHCAPDNPGMKTDTERLLRQAHLLASQVTGRPTVSDKLLVAVFCRLCYEHDGDVSSLPDDIDEEPAPGSALH